MAKQLSMVSRSGSDNQRKFEHPPNSGLHSNNRQVMAPKARDWLPESSLCLRTKAESSSSSQPGVTAGFYRKAGGSSMSLQHQQRLAEKLGKKQGFSARLKETWDISRTQDRQGL